MLEKAYLAKIAKIHAVIRSEFRKWGDVVSTYFILCQNNKDGGTIICVTTSCIVELVKGVHVRYVLMNESGILLYFYFFGVCY